MEKPVRLDILKEKKETRTFSRRQAIQWLLGGAGVGIAALPAIGENHPIYRHLRSASTLESADAQVGAGGWTPTFLSSHQSETLTALSERIIPGSSRTHVNRFIDLLLSVDTQENQKKFINSLSAFESASLGRFHLPFVGLTQAQQVELLTAATTTEGNSESKPDWGWFKIIEAQRSGDTGRVMLHEHLEHLKGWVSGAYYTSEIGMGELGWTGDSFFDEFPGCQHPESHH